MELFSLGTTTRDGTPNYSNDDVRQIARAFTGWSVETVNGVSNQAVFRTTRYDSDVKKIFIGTPWEGSVISGRDVVNHILTYHPNSGISLGKFFAEKYLRPDPDDGVINQLAYLIEAGQFQFPASTENFVYLRSILSDPKCCHSS